MCSKLVVSFANRDVDDDQQSTTAQPQSAFGQPGTQPIAQGSAVGSATSTSTAAANLGMVQQQQPSTSANIGVAGGATANPVKTSLSQSEG